jgi:hypothetical protein
MVFVDAPLALPQCSGDRHEILPVFSTGLLIQMGPPRRTAPTTNRCCSCMKMCSPHYEMLLFVRADDVRDIVAVSDWLLSDDCFDEKRDQSVSRPLLNRCRVFSLISDVSLQEDRDGCRRYSGGN